MQIYITMAQNDSRRNTSIPTDPNLQDITTSVHTVDEEGLPPSRALLTYLLECELDSFMLALFQDVHQLNDGLVVPIQLLLA